MADNAPAYHPPMDINDIIPGDDNDNYLDIQDMLNNIIEEMHHYPIEQLESYLQEQNEGEILFFPLAENITENLREVHRQIMNFKNFIFECLLNGEPISDSNTAQHFIFNLTDDQWETIIDGNIPDGIVPAPLPRQMNTHGLPYGQAHMYDFSRDGRDDATYLSHMLIDNDECHLIHITKCILTGLKVELNPENGEFILIDPPTDYENIFTSDWQRIELYLNLYRLNESSIQQPMV